MIDDGIARAHIVILVHYKYKPPSRYSTTDQNDTELEMGTYMRRVQHLDHVAIQ